MTEASSDDQILIRPAKPDDIDRIHDILSVFAQQRLLLPRPKSDLLEKIGNFRVICVNGKIAGFAALRDYGNGLYEVRSLAVANEYQNMGLASRLVHSQIKTVQDKNVPARIFSLTYREHFFNRLGFDTVDKSLFPEKIWSDCDQCPNRHKCDETAVLMLVNQDK